jgi:uncharacterized SAM-binding protein YcdF (DUF218 family)
MTLFSSDLQNWLLPPQVNIVILVLGMLIWFFAPRTGKVMAVIGIASVWMFSTPFIANHLIGILQNPYVMLDPEASGKHQSTAILVLGGGGSVDDAYRQVYTVSDVTLQRLKYAVSLYQKTHLPIIVSGGKTNGSNNSEADIMAKYLQENDNIIVAFKDEKSQSSENDHAYLASLFKQKHIDNIYLVTHAWDMARSQFIFECAGLKVTPAPMGYVESVDGIVSNWIPNLRALNVSAIAVHEFLSMFWYQQVYDPINCSL